MTDWQSIETAPKDGTLIDVWLGNAEKSDVELYCAQGDGKRSTGWYWSNGKFRPHMGLRNMMACFVCPTHWMPVPAPPEDATDD